MGFVVKNPSGVKSVMKEAQKNCGVETVAMGRDWPGTPAIPSGALAFDLATGGGIPRNRITLLHGNEGGGKSLLALCLIREYQKRYPKNPCVLIEPETALDTDWAKKIGVNTDALVVARPEYAEQAGDLICAFLAAPDCGLLVLDSIAVMCGKDEMEKSIEDPIVGGASKCINRTVRKANAMLRDSEKYGWFGTMLAINQPRFKTGVVYGNPEILPGGNQQLFQASLRVRLHGKSKMVADVSKGFPALLEVRGTIKKSRQPIASTLFKYEMVLVPHNGMGVGQCSDWNVFKQHASELGIMEKMKGGWGLTNLKTGEIQEFPTQAALWDSVRLSPGLLDDYRNAILTALLPGGKDG